jgi:hypothetical protein
VLPLEPLYDGPYRVLARSRDWFRIQVGDRTDTISTSRHEPCLDLSTPPAGPRRQGQPQSGHIPLAARGATANTPGCAGGPYNTFCAFTCAGRCEAANTTWAGAQNRFFSPAPGVFCMPGPLPGAVACHTDRAAAGQIRPVDSSGGSVWRQREVDAIRGPISQRSRRQAPAIVLMLYIQGAS